MQVLGARWKGLDDGAKATWAAAAPEYEVKPKKPKKAKLPALTDAERRHKKRVSPRLARLAKTDPVRSQAAARQAQGRH